MLKLFSLIAALFTKQHIDANAAATKIATVQTGIQTVHDVVSDLPDGNTKDAALKALDVAASASAEAIVVAHTIGAVQTSQAVTVPSVPTAMPEAETDTSV